MSTAKKFAGQTAVYGLSTIASRSLTFIMTSVYTRAYATAAYGIITIMYSYVSMTNAVLTFGMETTFFRYLNKHSDDKQRVYNNAFASVLAVTLLFLLFTLPFSNYLASFVDTSNTKRIAEKGIAVHSTLGTTHADFLKYIYLFMATVVVDAWCAIPFVKLRADGKPGRYGAIKLTSVLVFVALNLMFVYAVPFWLNHNYIGAGWISGWYTKGWVGYVFVSELSSSIITLFLLLPELLKIRFNLNRAMLVHMYGYSWPILIANLSYLVNENMDKILLGKLLPANSLRDVGIYGACCKIAVFLSIFINAFRLGAEPFFFNHAKNKNAGQTYARIMDYLIIAITLIFVGLIANIEILKYFIKGRNATETALFWSGLPVVPPLILGYVCLGVYMNLSVWYKLSDQTKYGLYISGIGALVTIVLNVIFIPKYSYMASAWVSLTAYTVMMILSYIWGQKNYPIPYNLKKNLTYIIISIILVYLSFYVFKRNIFAGNTLLILFAAYAFIMEGKQLKAIFKK
ncbi:O-antigen/teichoic acid export membrane protein [Mucilaginibacter yixingensis]|uniref:O-antigen/teichoic acid export membrane protein n=1 Tax=Mucilaginibacter yixingensis TaxID=1295612 RepID=A0A2T5JCI0_9SPHI|nr:polysaccharide biosynthesis C-terminal domain-containing protein [Mucilaginibacter yixingensis]PTQ99469.1 O-antigen/teichoic acid export membrane protein [Mucilaginibacter yixingensis]